MSIMMQKKPTQFYRTYRLNTIFIFTRLHGEYLIHYKINHIQLNESVMRLTTIFCSYCWHRFTRVKYIQQFCMEHYSRNNIFHRLLLSSDLNIQWQKVNEIKKLIQNGNKITISNSRNTSLHLIYKIHLKTERWNFF